jgi:hypothetical protein
MWPVSAASAAVARYAFGDIPVMPTLAASVRPSCAKLK